MLNKKFNNTAMGFTLIETLIALFIVGLFVGALFKFQGNLLKTSQMGHNILDQISLSHNAFVDADQEAWYKKNQSKKVDNFQDSKYGIVYKLEKISPKSSLSKIKNLYLETVDVLNSKNILENSFINFRFVHEEIKSE